MYVFFATLFPTIHPTNNFLLPFSFLWCAVVVERVTKLVAIPKKIERRTVMVIRAVVLHGQNDLAHVCQPTHKQY